MSPNSMEYIRSFTGSLSGINHRAGTEISVPKNTLDTTSTASPKYPPNITPQNRVEMPQ